MSITAMKLALEAMTYADACLKKQLTTRTKHEYAQDLLLEAGTALSQAIEQAEQAQPVGWYDSMSGQMDFTFYKPHRKPSSPSAEWIPVYKSPTHTPLQPLTDEYKQDALRWRYTQQEGYFEIQRDDISDLWKVGVQPEGRSVNNSIQGIGESLEEAIDKAIAAHGITGEA